MMINPNQGEQYYQLTVEPNNPDRYMSPTINVLCRPQRLKATVADMESRESLKVTRVYDDNAHEVPEVAWRYQVKPQRHS